jgi:hypothetical protein
VLEDALEGLRLPGVDRDHKPWIHLSNELAQVPSKDVTRGMKGKQVTAGRLDLRPSGYPIRLLQVTFPTRIDAPYSIRQPALEVTFQHGWPE